MDATEGILRGEKEKKYDSIFCSFLFDSPNVPKNQVHIYYLAHTGRVNVSTLNYIMGNNPKSYKILLFLCSLCSFAYQARFHFTVHWNNNCNSFFLFLFL